MYQQKIKLKRKKMGKEDKFKKKEFLKNSPKYKSPK